jgi:hypothetical protein
MAFADRLEGPPCGGLSTGEVQNGQLRRYLNDKEKFNEYL